MSKVQNIFNELLTFFLIRFDKNFERLHKRSSFLLCSDGFWELIDEKQMSKTLKKADSPQQWLAAMEEIILANGKGTNMDNYSAIAVFVRDK